MSVEEIKNEAVKIIRNHFSGNAKIYLFGSRAKGKAKPTSDIDIAVQVSPFFKKKEKEFSRIREELEMLRTLRKIDIIDLSLTTPKFKKHILKYAVPL